MSVTVQGIPLHIEAPLQKAAVDGVVVPIAKAAVAERFSLSWKDSVVLSGIALSVVSAVAAFFSGAVLMGLSSLFVGSTLSFSGYYVHCYNDALNLENMLDMLKSENQKMQEVNQTFQKHVTSLETECKGLQQTVDSLEGKVNRVSHVNSALSYQSKTAEETVRTLKMQNSQLQTQVTEFHGLIQNMTQQAEREKAATQQLTQDLEQLRTHAGVIEQQLEAFKKMGTDFKEEVERLSLEVTKARETAQQAIQRLSEEKLCLQVELTKLQQEVGKLHEIEATLPKRQAELATLNETIGVTTTDLHQAKEALAATTKEFADIKTQLEDQIKHVQQLQADGAKVQEERALAKEQITQFTNQLQELQQRMAAEATRLQKELDTQITQREAKITNLDVQIATKTAVLQQPGK